MSDQQPAALPTTLSDGDEAATAPAPAPAGPVIDWRFNHAIAVLIAVVTVLAAVIVALQNDAAARDDRANRESREYAAQALGRTISGDARVSFDVNAAYQTWRELDLLATSAEKRDDAPAAQRYRTVRDRLTRLSPLLAPPYFNPATGEINQARYEAEVYLVEVTALRERVRVATVVKEAWDLKANTYILHLTLLAVTLSLLGLSTTLPGRASRWIFAGSGVTVALVASVWAVVTWTRPVDDLRQHANAIDAYARGVGLAHQRRWTEAIAAYDAALQAAPDYAQAFTERAQAQSELGNSQAAAADFERARRAGDRRAFVAGSLAWSYFELGRFAEASALNRSVLQASPHELWMQFDVGLSLLAAGQPEAARAAYAEGMALATSRVAAARAAGQEPPSSFWWSLDDAAMQLDRLLTTVETGQGKPARATLAHPELVPPLARDLIGQLKSLAVALEYTGQPPAGTLTATIGPLGFSEPLYDDDDVITDYRRATTFEQGVKEIAVRFDYRDIRAGQEVLVKVYVDGEEDASWRQVTRWPPSAAGTATNLLTVGHSDAFVLPAGEYVVEYYVDAHLAQRGTFTIRP